METQIFSATYFRVAQHQYYLPQSCCQRLRRIRAVDELPDVLFYKLNNGHEMNLVSLPPIEEDPRDEQTDSFREALINAHLTDENYAAAMEAVDRDADDYPEKSRAIERELKDKVRAELGLAPRVQKSENQ